MLPIVLVSAVAVVLSRCELPHGLGNTPLHLPKPAAGLLTPPTRAAQPPHRGPALYGMAVVAVLWSTRTASGLLVRPPPLSRAG